MRWCGGLSPYGLSFCLYISVSPFHEAVALWDYLLTCCWVGFGWLAMYKREHTACLGNDEYQEKSY